VAAPTTHRQLFDIELEPVAGSRFQPTGFPDIGAALFERPIRDDGQLRWVEALVVESAQSMANRLEEVGWDRTGERPVAPLEGLPYVRVVAADDGRYLTSSRTEAHRLASAFVKHSALDGRPMVEVIKERLGLRDDTPLAPRDIAAEVFALDPLSLVHGVFFADDRWPGQPKVARAITGFVEAVDVRPAISGGVKRDDVRHQVGESGGTAEGYGFVPFHRTEYTAGRILASFCIDRAQMAAYGLGEAATELLEAIARWEIRSLLDRGLRLRTACDLVPTAPDVRDRDGQPLPSLAECESALSGSIGHCRELLGDGRPLEVAWKPPGKRAKRGSSEA
jgi:CRISPR-associated protein Csb1